MSSIVRLAQIRSLMFDIEQEADLGRVSGLEREVLLACADLSQNEAYAKTQEILGHRFLNEVSRPSIFRALKSLVNKNLLIQSNGFRGSYKINQSPQTMTF